MIRLIDKLYFNKVISRVFHTSVYCLKKELRDCESVLDLGCGPKSPVEHIPIQYSLGVEFFEPYLKESMKRRIHDKYIHADVREIEFKPKSFDCVVLIGVLEHLTKEEGYKLIHKMDKIARKKIVISTTNGFLPQSEIDHNILQTHKSGWTVDELRNLGYKARGMTGWKFLRRGNICKELGAEDAIYSTIKFKPRFFWLIISELTQLITYYFPKISFEIFCVKNLNED